MRAKWKMYRLSRPDQVRINDLRIGLHQRRKVNAMIAGDGAERFAGPHVMHSDRPMRRSLPRLALLGHADLPSVRTALNVNGAFFEAECGLVSSRHLLTAKSLTAISSG